jgi:hypothetical protein
MIPSLLISPLFPTRSFLDTSAHGFSAAFLRNERISILVKVTCRSMIWIKRQDPRRGLPNQSVAFRDNSPGGVSNAKETDYGRERETRRHRDPFGRPNISR